MPPLSVTLLGGFEARSSSGPIVVSLRKAQALLAYLAFRPGQPHPRGKLAALLWGDAGEEEARNSLRQTLFGLRRAVAVVKGPVLLTNGESVTISTSAVSVDVPTFERLVREGTTRALEEAVALYRGELLEGLNVPEAPFEDWLMGERRRLREQAVGALEKLLRDHLAAGENDRAIQAALRLLAIEPLQEAVHRKLMRLYGREGRHAMALRQYQACVDVLQRELRIEPEAETKELYRQLLRQRSIGSGHARRARERHVRPVGPPLIGRDAELATLRRALRHAMTGRGQVIVVQGEAGIGKTRLVEELAADVGDQDCRLLHGRAYASERILPFSVWLNALRAGQVMTRADVLQGLGPVWRRQLARLFPEIDPVGSALTITADDYRQLFEAVDRLVARLAAEERLLFVLEDVHWSDDMSLRLLAFLGRRAVDRPMLMVATLRSEEMSDAPELGQTLAELGRERHLTALTLEPLSRANTLALARSLAPAGLDDWAPARVAEHVWAVSDGNPLIVVETIRALREGGIPADASPLAVPEGVREMIAARLGRLEERASELAAVAAVIGREFEFGVLQRASALNERQAAAAVEELVRRRVLHEVGERFDFTHERIREVMYANLVTPRRRLLHAAVARALEELHAARLEPHYGSLGQHYREGQVWDKAVAYLRLAGQQAAARGAYREAVALIEQALDALAHLPECRETLEQAVDLRFDLRNALQPLSEFPRVIECLRVAETLAATLGDQRRLGWVASNLSTVLFHLGDWSGARAAGRSALDIAAAVGDSDLQISTRFRLGMASYSPGEYRGAVELLECCVETLGSDVDRRIFGMTGMLSVLARHWLTWCRAELGDFAEGIVRGEEAVRIASAADHPYSLGAACHGLGYLYLRRGAINKAVPLLERSLAACRAADGSLPWLWAASALGAAYALAGRHAEALPLLEGAVRQAEERRRREGHAQRLAWLAEAHLLADRLAEAREVGTRALHAAREHRERGHEAWALRVLAEIHATSDASDKAETSYLLALAVAEELGMRPLLAHCHLGLARLYRRRGRATVSRSHFLDAIDLLRAMEMTRWLAAAQTEAMAPPVAEPT